MTRFQLITVLLLIFSVFSTSAFAAPYLYSDRDDNVVFFELELVSPKHLIDAQDGSLLLSIVELGLKSGDYKFVIKSGNLLGTSEGVPFDLTLIVSDTEIFVRITPEPGYEQHFDMNNLEAILVKGRIIITKAEFNRAKGDRLVVKALMLYIPPESSPESSTFIFTKKPKKSKKAKKDPDLEAEDIFIPTLTLYNSSGVEIGEVPFYRLVETGTYEYVFKKKNMAEPGNMVTIRSDTGAEASYPVKYK